MAVETTAAVPAPGHTFWALLGVAERAAIRSVATPRRYGARDVVCHEGEDTRYVLVLTRGSVRVTVSAPDGRDMVLAVRGPGDIVGELAAVDAAGRSATVTAMDAVEALTTTGERFAHLCRSNGRIGWALLTVVVSRWRDTGRQWTEFGGGSARQRLVALLLDLAARSGRATPLGIVIATGRTQQDLADTVATARETVVRVLHDLREEGIVSTSRGRITIHRLDALRALAP